MLQLYRLSNLFRYEGYLQYRLTNRGHERQAEANRKACQTSYDLENTENGLVPILVVLLLDALFQVRGRLVGYQTLVAKSIHGNDGRDWT